MKNSDILSWICDQVEIILLEFTDSLENSGYTITSLSRHQAVFENRHSEQLIKFVFANKYTYGLGIQPLQDIIIESKSGKQLLSKIVDDQEGKGAFRKYLSNREPAISRTAVFYDLYSRYLAPK